MSREPAGLTTRELILPASLRALLAGVIDYAGLFPPARLSMPDAIAKYAGYLEGELGWVLGRFVVPVSRLAEFADIQAATQTTARWRVSCLLGSDVDSDFSTILRFNDRDDAVIAAVETRAETAEQVAHVMQKAPEGIEVYFEVPWLGSSELIAAIQKSGARAKVRTGGLTPEAIPPTETVARAILSLARAGVRFKATAGLHHPLRCLAALTYEPNAPVAKMHGFLNIFLAAAYQGERERVAAILDWDRGDQLHFDESGAQIMDVVIPTDQIRTTRERFAISFGSCSFEEPIGDLRALRLL
jgi:hypothetical protein